MFCRTADIFYFILQYNLRDIITSV